MPREPSLRDEGLTGSSPVVAVWDIILRLSKLNAGSTSEGTGSWLDSACQQTGVAAGFRATSDIFACLSKASGRCLTSSVGRAKSWSSDTGRIGRGGNIIPRGIVFVPTASVLRGPSTSTRKEPVDPWEVLRYFGTSRFTSSPYGIVRRFEDAVPTSSMSIGAGQEGVGGPIDRFRETLEPDLYYL